MNAKIDTQNLIDELTKHAPVKVASITHEYPDFIWVQLPNGFNVSIGGVNRDAVEQFGWNDETGNCAGSVSWDFESAESVAVELWAQILIQMGVAIRQNNKGVFNLVGGGVNV